VIKPLLKS